MTLPIMTTVDLTPESPAVPEPELAHIKVTLAPPERLFSPTPLNHPPNFCFS